MCGIIGFASISGCPDRNWLRLACSSLAHRGPDGSGEWWSNDGRVGLGHRRLSIIDLSTSGSQPMHRHDLGLSIVFNGEIYNYIELRKKLEQCGHRFYSQSDTEVLIVAYSQWGKNFIKRLNGMFAFAIFDSLSGTLFIARDRVGEKPLFYRLYGQELYFASELKALVSNQSLPKHIDSSALDCYLSMGYIPGNLCILKGYNKLPPGHAMSFDLKNGVSNQWKYWSVPQFDISANEADENELLDELELLLEDAVGRQLIADVPLGILLSGGVDSSLITALAVRKSRNVRTFSIGFPGHSEHDETKYARLISEYFGTNHTELIAEPTSADILPSLSVQFDEPMADSSMFPTWLVSSLVRQHCTVALGGDGGDELFGGYGHYSRLLELERMSSYIPLPLRRALAKSAEYVLPLGFGNSNVRTWIMSAGSDFKNDLPNLSSLFDVRTRRQLLKSNENHSFTAETIRSLRIPHDQDLLQRATRMDFENYLAEDILVKVDRASMMNSLEIRAPLLDYRVVEFAFRKVPSRLKVTEQEKKILLKRLAVRILPKEFDVKRKQGFSIPIAEWLKKGPFRDMFWDTLTSSDCMFDAKVIKSLLSGQDKGRKNGERLFALVLFEQWRKAYGVGY